MNSYEYVIKIDKKDIEYISKILDAYDNLAILRTSKVTNEVKIFTTIYQTDELEAILKMLNVDILSKKIFQGEII